MGAGIASLTNPSDPNRRLVSGTATAGGLIGIIATERYLDPSADAGRQGMRLTLNPMSMLFVAAHTPGNHSLLNVRF